MKKLTLLIIIILLLGGIVYYLSGHPPQTTTPNPVQPTSGVSDRAAVSDLAANYYKFYDSCMKNPPTEAAGIVGEYCQKNSGLTSAAFVGNLEKGGTAKAGADPIFCAQDIPESVTVDPDVQITADTAVAFMDEKFGPSQIKIRVDVSKENGEWKIANITCPLP